MRVLVLNGCGNNLGDQAIMAGTARLLEGHDVKVGFVYYVKWTVEIIERINRDFDLVIVGGGGLVYHRPTSESRTGWGLDLPAELLPKLTTPIALFAAGYNYRAGCEPHFPPRMASHFASFCRHACYVSVRDWGSAHRLGALLADAGVGRARFIVPDLAIHVDPVPVKLPSPCIACSQRVLSVLAMLTTGVPTEHGMITAWLREPMTASHASYKPKRVGMFATSAAPYKPGARR